MSFQCHALCVEVLDSPLFRLALTLFPVQDDDETGPVVVVVADEAEEEEEGGPGQQQEGEAGIEERGQGRNGQAEGDGGAAKADALGRKFGGTKVGSEEQGGH